MSTRSSPTSSRSERNATCTTPSGASAPEPVASFAAGTPKSTTAGIPRSASARTSLRRLSWVCWSTPGIDATGSGASIPSFTKSGATRSSTSTRVSPTSRRNAGVRRNRRDRCSGNATQQGYRSTRSAPTSNGGLRSRLMIARFGLLLSCVTLVVAQGQPGIRCHASCAGSRRRRNASCSSATRRPRRCCPSCGTPPLHEASTSSRRHASGAA